jgi:hypothetical protein
MKTKPRISIFKVILELGIADTFTSCYWEDYIPYGMK